MRSFLIPTGGAGSDESVLETALAAARPFAAHLNFLHIRVGAGQAAMHSPHADFASGPALRGALTELAAEAGDRANNAARHVRDFCARSNVAICDAPGSSTEVTANWRVEEEQDNAL